MARSVVVFPQPDGPSRHRISPLRAQKEISEIASRPASYAQVTLRSSRTIGPVPSFGRLLATASSGLWAGSRGGRSGIIQLSLHRARRHANLSISAASGLGVSGAQSTVPRVLRADLIPHWPQARPEPPAYRTPPGGAGASPAIP